ncbi:MAG TPA: dihydrofolate reductase, partial [Acidothermaceae bacterium]|nr:dihydrofolate reductase [Acidothermaceae bacterium]
MRNIIWLSGVSVDGYMEGPDHNIDWHVVDDEFFSHMVGWLAGVGGLLEGRVTYELMAAHWPTADQAP